MSTPTNPPEFTEAVLDAVSPSRLASRLEATASELIDVACVQSQAPDFDPAAALQDMASKTARLLHHTARMLRSLDPTPAA